MNQLFSTTTAVVLLLSAIAATAQSSDEWTAAYRRAEEARTGKMAARALNVAPSPAWDASSDRFWIRLDRIGGSGYVSFDPVHRTQRPAFDHVRLAQELGRLLSKPVDSEHLQLDGLTLDEAKGSFSFSSGDQRIDCHLDTYRCEFESRGPAIPLSIASPDGARVILAKDNNLVLHDVRSGVERALTNDGIANFAYGKMPDAALLAVLQQTTGRRFPPFGVQFSPDGTHVVVMRVDERALPEYHFLQSVPTDNTLRPKVLTMRTPLSAEPYKAPVEVSVIDVASGRKKTVEVGEEGLSLPFWWSIDGTRLLALQGGDNTRKETLYEVDVETAAARQVFQEQSATFLQISPLEYDEPAVRFLQRSNEMIWFSQRDGWNHLYLLDLKTGVLKAQLGKGDWSVQNIVSVDEARRLVYFAAVGREHEENPYYRHLYSVKFDGTGLRLLTPGAADHAFPAPVNPAVRDALEALGLNARTPQTMSPSMKYFIDRSSTASSPPRTVLRKNDGNEVMVIAQTDSAALENTGWVAPEEVRETAADGKSQLYGLLFKPPHFDPNHRYAVVECIYNGPQVVTTPHDFEGVLTQWMGRCGESYAQLGFVSLVMDGRGTPMRSKAFQDYMYNNMQEFAVEDHVAFLKELAAARPYLDLDRLGVVGHSFGGFTSMKAILGYPDFYKVAVSSAGPYNMYGMYPLDAFFAPPVFDGGWSPKKRPTNWGNVDLTQQAERLKGKLLIGYGDLDENAYPASTAQMINALIAANKEFDLIYMPNRTHAFEEEPYFIRRSWDYFVRNLLHQEPPKDYQFGSD